MRLKRKINQTKKQTNNNNNKETKQTIFSNNFSQVICLFLSQKSVKQARTIYVMG